MSWFSAILPNEILKFNFDLKYFWKQTFFHYEKIMRFKKWPQLPGAGRSRAGHHHGSHTPTSPEAVLLGKMACQPKHFGRQCRSAGVQAPQNQLTLFKPGVQIMLLHYCPPPPRIQNAISFYGISRLCKVKYVTGGFSSKYSKLHALSSYKDQVVHFRKNKDQQ